VKKKRFYKRPVFWLAIVLILGIWLSLRMFSPTNIAETTPDHQETALQTRRYPLKGDLKQMRQAVEKVIPNISTSIWGGKWKLAAPQNGDSAENKEKIRVEVPVVIFTDDLWIELKQEGGEVIVNARSNSRVGKSDLGENRRHLLQILKETDALFAK
jgi:hypothetical protein